jgi:glycosyltransferase involved in cell wall biosynthesis
MLIQGYHPRIGGAETQLKALLPYLREQGVQALVLTRRYSGLAAKEIIEGTPVRRLPAPGPKPLAAFSYSLSALPALASFRPHLIHAHELLSPASTAVLAKRLLGCPIVVKVLRGGLLGDLANLRTKPFGTRRLQLYRDHFNLFLAISREIESELIGIGTPTERVAYLPNGVDCQRFKPSRSEAEKQVLRGELGLPAGLLAVYTGRFAPEKRLDRLIALWPQVQAACPGATLVLVGTGEQAAGLQAIAGAGVQFIGPVDQVAPYLQAADVFVLPSKTEGLSNALLEAMACGLPAIATRVGGAPDVIFHRQNGWLAAPESPGELREGLVLLLSDPALRAQLGNQARASMEIKFSLAVIAERLRCLYDRTLQGRPAGELAEPGVVGYDRF